MGKMRIFNQEEIQKIINCYTDEKYSIEYIAKNIVHSRTTAVKKILVENGIQLRTNHKPKGGRVFNSATIGEIIQKYTQENFNQRQLAELYSTTSATIHSILIDNNITIKQRRIVNAELNEAYFDNIDSEHKAYFLGFIFADGNISNDYLSIEISAKDKYLLEEFKTQIHSNCKIYCRKRDNSELCSVRIKSQLLCKALSKYGIVPNKTYVTKHLPVVKQEFMRHFIRGLIDGDGWITRDSHGYYHFGFVSNYQSTCEDFKKYCNLLTNNKCNASISRKGSTPMFQIQSKEAAKCLANILYKDSTIYLSRKYAVAEPLLDFKNDEDIV